MANSTLIHTCPECSRVIYFSGSATNMIVCTSCGATLLKDEHGTIVSKPVLKAGNEMTIIQPGTTGVWKNKPFTISGRFRLWFEESVINYWTALFNDGTFALLEEGYGMYNLMVPVTTPSMITSSRLDHISPGERLEVYNGKIYIAEKKQYILHYEMEGEAYLPHQGEQVQLVQCSNHNNNTYLFFNYKRKGIYTFDLAPYNTEQLQLKNLRSFHFSNHSFTCNNCSAKITVKTFPLAQSCSCTECGYAYELYNGTDFKGLSEKIKTGENYIYLTLGSKATLYGHEYEVIGFTCKEELNEYRSQWREYVLFNPEAGYAFLSEYNGNWIFIRETSESPVLESGDARQFSHRYFEYRNKSFDLFNYYRARVVEAAGEFPYNIFNNNNTTANEFIAPPEMWIMEKNNREGITWYHGKNISRREIKKGFGIKELPDKTGIGAVQPKGRLGILKVMMAGIAGCLLIFLLHTFTSSLQQNRELFVQTIPFSDTSDKITLVTGKFEFDKKSSNVLLRTESPVLNNWVEVAVSLVNANTGKEYSQEQGIEYYEGYSEGERWTEGSNHQNIWFRKIPSGTYFFQVEAQRETRANIPWLLVSANYDVPSDRNVYIACLFMGIFCVLQLINSYNSNRQRWSNSPFHNQGNNDEE